MALRGAASDPPEPARNGEEEQPAQGVANKPQAQPEALMRNRHQAIPEYARRSILQPLRSRLPIDTTDWEKTLRADPCAYCNEPANEVDHIRPRVAGGRDSWQNTTGSCHHCNQAKASTRLLQFLSGRRVPLRILEPRLERLDGNLVAIADLRRAPYDPQGPRDRSSRLLTALLTARPEADGAVLYGLREQKGQHPSTAWVHILRMRPGTADAGAICRRHGGGGSVDYGGFVSKRLLFGNPGPTAAETGTQAREAAGPDPQPIYGKTAPEPIKNDAMRPALPHNVQNAISDIRRIAVHERMRNLRIRTSDERNNRIELYASAYLQGADQTGAGGNETNRPPICQPIARGIRMIRKSLSRNGFDAVVINTYDSRNGGTVLNVNATKTHERARGRRPPRHGTTTTSEHPARP